MRCPLTDTPRGSRQANAYSGNWLVRWRARPTVVGMWISGFCHVFCYTALEFSEAVCSSSSWHAHARLVSRRSCFVAVVYQLCARRVAFTVGRSVCFCEKRSIRSAKSRRYSSHHTATCADLKAGVEYISLHSPFLVPSRSIKPLRSTAILRLRRRCSTAESRRGILMEGRGGAPIALL